MAVLNNELLIKLRLDLGNSGDGFGKAGKDVEKIGQAAERAKTKVDSFIAALSKSLSTGEIKVAVGFAEAGKAADVATRKAQALNNVLDRLNKIGIDSTTAKSISQLALSMGALSRETSSAGNNAASAKAKLDPFIAELSKSQSFGEIKMAVGISKAGEAAAAKRQIDDLAKSGNGAGDKIASGANKAESAISGMRNQFLGFLSIYKGIEAAKGLVNISAQFAAIDKSLQSVTGSAQAAAKAMASVRDTANAFGLDLKGTASAYAQFNAAAAGSVLEGAEAEKIFKAVAKASGALGLSMDDTHGALIAIGQMFSKGTIQAEELRGQLGERLPGAFNIMARAVGVSTTELNTMLDAGQVGIEQLPKFAAELDKTFQNARFDDIQSSINRISTAWDNLANSAGKAIKLDVILKTVADIVTPETQDQERARLKVQTNGLDRLSLVDNLRYRLSTASFSDFNGQSLGADQTRYNQLARQKKAADAGDFFMNGTEMGKELDALIADQTLSAKNYQIVTQGVADATSRLWDQNRKKIEEQERADQSAAKSREDSAKRASEAYAREREAIAATIEQLQFEYQALQLSDQEREIQIKLRGLSGKATADERQQIEGLVRAIDAEVAAQKRQQAAWDQAVQDANAWVDIRKQIQQFGASDVSLSGFNSLLDQIKELQNAGAIDTSQTKAAFDELGKAWNDGYIAPAKQGATDLSEFTIQAARNMQTTFADFLFDPFKNGTEGMVQGFADALRRMLADAASAQIFEALLGKDFGKSNAAGGLLQSLGGAIVGAFAGGSSFQGNGPLLSYSNHSGGLAGQHPYKSFDAALFNTAPRYHGGGIAGLAPNEVPTILTKGEEVLTPNDPRHRNNFTAAGNVTVNVINNASGTKATANQRQTDQGTQIDIMVEQIEGRIGGNIARGTGLAPVLENQYGLNRAAGSR